MSSCQKTTTLTEFEIKWRVPFTAIGFYIIQNLKENGTKNIERPKNYGDIIKGLKYVNS